MIAAYIRSLRQRLDPCPAGDRSCIDAASRQAETDDGEQEIHAGLSGM
jgi:hypothetical protein